MDWISIVSLIIAGSSIMCGIAYFIFRLEYHIRNDKNVAEKLDKIIHNQQQGVTNAELRELIKEQTMLLRQIREEQIKRG